MSSATYPEILIDKDMYKSPKYVVDYRLFICYALFVKFKKSDHELLELASELNKFINHISSEEHYETNDFPLKAYPFLVNHIDDIGLPKGGVVIKDTTHGCYPLIWYNNNYGQPTDIDLKPWRLGSFINASKEVEAKIGNIRIIFENSTDTNWNTLKQELISLFSSDVE